MWEQSWRADPRSRRVADRHYNRQSIGAAQFVPPGRCQVLYRRTDAGQAFWVTSWPFPEYVKHAWPGAWVCSAFRNEGAGLSSDLIIAAVGAARSKWEPPPLGMITFVNHRKVRGKRDPGYCFLVAGFQRVGTTKAGLIALQLLPEAMPEARPPTTKQLSLLGR